MKTKFEKGSLELNLDLEPQLNTPSHDDCRSFLRSLPDGSVHCVVTSPPYWNLRRYAGEQLQVWQDDPDCEHDWGGAPPSPTKLTQGGNTEVVKNPKLAAEIQRRKGRGRMSEGTIKAQTEIAEIRKVLHRTNMNGGKTPKQMTHPGSYGPSVVTSFYCSKCGAWKGSLGLEPTPEQYVKNLVEIFAEVHRVLHPSGTFWLNIGDTYIGSGKGALSRPDHSYQLERYVPGKDDLLTGFIPSGYKPKDKAGIPEQTVNALRNWGWYWRDTIIWMKNSSMPSSVRDRTTPNFEYVYMLTKEGSYFYDQEAGKEDAVTPAGTVAAKASAHRRNGAGVNSTGTEGRVYTGKRNKRSIWMINPSPSNWDFCLGCKTLFEGRERKRLKVPVKKGTTKQGKVIDGSGEIKATYAGFNERYFDREPTSFERQCPNCKGKEFADHFAAFPKQLVREVLELGVSKGGMCKCGQPMERIVEVIGENPKTTATRRTGKEQLEANLERTGFAEPIHGHGNITPDGSVYAKEKKTVGYMRTCGCGGGACSKCGTPWERVVKKSYKNPKGREQEKQGDWKVGGAGKKEGNMNSGDYPTGKITKTLGWKANCKCNADTLPCTVLDAFMGSGTTALVAEEMNLNWYGCDISEEYVAIQVARLERQRKRTASELGSGWF